MPNEPLRQLSFAALLGLAWLLMAVQLLALHWGGDASVSPDADDVLRLLEVRNFLAGQGWFDLREPRLGLPPGYESHWSRLIDAGLAGFFLFFRLFTDTPMAERLMGVAWPLLWLIPATLGTAAIAWRLGRKEAALAALLMAVLNLPGMEQFRPSRIDHHNVQIALALLTVAATVWSDRRRWTAFAAGACTGWSLAIGLEALAIHALCGAALALRYVVEPNAARMLRDYGFALAGSTLLAFLVSVGPEHWTRAVCDALAVNLAAAVIVAGVGVGVIAGRGGGPVSRLAAMAGLGAAAAAVFVAMQPQCLRGPFAQIDPALWSIWLDHVSEGQSLPAMVRSTPGFGIAMAASPALALAALLMVACRNRGWRDFGFGVAAGAFLISLATMIGAIKAFPYVSWLGIPFVAVAALQVFALVRLNGLVPQMFTIVLIAPSVVSSGVLMLTNAVGNAEEIDPSKKTHQACISRTNLTPFAALPPGLVVANLIDWGPYLLAWTPHRVLSAPYHRLSDSILTAHRIFAAPPDAARTILSQIKADYVVVCGTQGPAGQTKEAQDVSLWGRLQAGPAPDWLVPLRLDAGPWQVYRVKPGL
jgi:hypothetical protein